MPNALHVAILSLAFAILNDGWYTLLYGGVAVFAGATDWWLSHYGL
jgi:hypothetical protein